MRQKARIDSNQNSIIKELRRIPGVSVRVTSMVGQGMGDFLIGFRGATYIIELKDPSKPPSKRRLTRDEEKFRDSWTGSYNVCETLEEILSVIKLRVKV